MAGTSLPTSTSRCSRIAQSCSARRQVRTSSFAALVLALAASGRAPNRYDCRHTAKPIKVDGRLDESEWKLAPWSADFVDIEGDAKPRPRFRTRMKMLWDDVYLYIGAELEEPDVWAS